MSTSPFRLQPGPKRRAAMRDFPGGSPNLSELDFTDAENTLVEDWAAQAEQAIASGDFSTLPAIPKL